AGTVDGRAHRPAALASVAHVPDEVFRNLHAASVLRHLPVRGRYGLAPVHVDDGWVGRDMIGIDAGAAVLALDNVLHDGRVRHTFHGLPWVRRGLASLGPARQAA